MPEDFAQGFIEDGSNEPLDEALWNYESDYEEDGTTDEQYFADNQVTLERKGKTIPLFKEEVMEKAKEYLSKNVKDVHEELKTFAFRKSLINQRGIKYLTKIKDNNCYKFDSENLEARDVTK